MSMTRWLLGAASCLLAGCVGSTGGEKFDFDAFASGAPGADGVEYRFHGGRGGLYDVVLTRAHVFVGAVYLNRSVATSVATDTSCTLAGTYVAEVTSGLVVDALSPASQPFPTSGTATSDPAHTGEVWLASGDINALDDSRVVLDVAGSATRGGETYPFEGKLSIGAARALPPPDPALPGARPICKERVVSPIPVSITPAESGRLHVTVDAARMFTNVDFATLERSADGVFVFDDESRTQASRNLYDGLRYSTGVYVFDWEN